MSTLELSPYSQYLIMSSKFLTPVNKLLNPINVPPPIIVPDTLSKAPDVGLTLIIDTPDPIDTNILDLGPCKKLFIDESSSVIC